MENSFSLVWRRALGLCGEGLYACVEKGFTPVWREALGLCGEALGLCGVGRFARAHVKSPTFHSRSQCISTERKQRHLCSEFSSA